MQIVEDGKRNSPDSLPRNAPVIPSLELRRQPSTRRFRNHTHLLHGLLSRRLNSTFDGSSHHPPIDTNLVKITRVQEMVGNLSSPNAEITGWTACKPHSTIMGNNILSLRIQILRFKSGNAACISVKLHLRDKETQKTNRQKTCPFVYLFFVFCVCLSLRCLFDTNNIQTYITQQQHNALSQENDHQSEQNDTSSVHSVLTPSLSTQNAMKLTKARCFNMAVSTNHCRLARVISGCLVRQSCG